MSTGKNLLTLVALMFAFAATGVLAFITAATQAISLAALTAGASLAFLPEDTVPDPCDTQYNCALEQQHKTLNTNR